MSGNRTSAIGNLLENYGQKQVLMELETLVNQYKRHDSLNPGIYTCEVIAGVTGIYCPVSFMLDAMMTVVAMLGIMCIVSLCIIFALCAITNHRLSKSTIQTRIIALAQKLEDPTLREIYTNFGKYPDSCVSLL